MTINNAGYAMTMAMAVDHRAGHRSEAVKAYHRWKRSQLDQAMLGLTHNAKASPKTRTMTAQQVRDLPTTPPWEREEATRRNAKQQQRRTIMDLPQVAIIRTK